MTTSVPESGEVQAGLGGSQEIKDVDLVAVLQANVAGGPGAGADHDVGVAVGLELGHIGHLDAKLDLGAKGAAELHVTVDVLVGDAEGRDDVAGDATQALLALEDGDLGAGARQEERAGQAQPGRRR